MREMHAFSKQVNAAIIIPRFIAIVLKKLQTLGHYSDSLYDVRLR